MDKYNNMIKKKYYVEDVLKKYYFPESNHDKANGK